MTLYQDDGGHSVHGGLSFPIEATQCASCVAGICQCGLACMLPEPEPAASRRCVFAFACFGAIAGLAAVAACVQALGLI